MKMNLLKKLLAFFKEKADFFQFIFRYAMFPNCKQQQSPLTISSVNLTESPDSFMKTSFLV